MESVSKLWKGHSSNQAKVDEYCNILDFGQEMCDDVYNDNIPWLSGIVDGDKCLFFLAFIDLVSCVAIPLTVSERRSCGLQGVAVVTAKCGNAEIWRVEINNTHLHQTTLFPYNLRLAGY